MAKRFTDNEKWKKRYFKGLSTVNKLFFLYVLDECDNAGIWNVEIDIAELRIGEKLDEKSAVKELGKHLHIFDDGGKWFLPSFIDFQYGELNPSVNAHKSVIGKLKKYKLDKKYEQFINCSRRDQDKDKDKDMDKDMDKDKDKKKSNAEIFDEFRKLYLGTKRGNETEYKNFIKHKDYKEVVGKLKEIIEKQIDHRKKLKQADNFVPQWKNLKTWINGRCWEDELPEVVDDKKDVKLTYEEVHDIFNGKFPNPGDKKIWDKVVSFKENENTYWRYK